MKIKTSNVRSTQHDINQQITTKPPGLKDVCTDINGRQFGQGDLFTPKKNACNRCLCVNGQAEKCVILQCPKPTCEKFERVPGTCCQYKCTRDFVLTDKSTAAVVASLSIILLVILVAISLVWKKMKKKEKYAQHFQSISPSSSQQETDLDSLIQKNSIPNNLRNTNTVALKNNISKDASKNPLLSDHEERTNTSCDKNINNEQQKLSSNSHTRTNSPTHAPYNINTNYTVAVCDSKENNFLASGADSCTTCTNSSVCLHKMRRFEPPPPYTPPDSKDHTVAFV